MSILVRDTGSLKGMSGLSVRDASNALKDAASIWMRTASGALKLIWTSFSATLDSATAEGGVSRYRTMYAETNKVTANVVGGVAPYTYQWERTDSDPKIWHITNTDAATTSFSAMVDNGDEFFATFRCTVTDATGAAAVTSDVSANLFNGWIAP